MPSRKALLMGAELYGEGFASLPAVRRDIEHMRTALQASGYEVELCPPEVLTNAGLLARQSHAQTRQSHAQILRR